MRRPAAFWVAIGLACFAGIGCGRILLPSAIFRDQLGQIFNRGHLLALVDGHGIYQADLSRRMAESAYLVGTKEGERTKVEREAALTGIAADIAGQERAMGEKVLPSELTSQLNLLRFQFSDENTWAAAVSKSSLSRASIARMLKNNLKPRQWLDRRIESELSVTDDECRQFYDSHRDQFFLPERRNLSHLFLVAPPETPPDVVEAKRAAIEALSARLAAGEDFATLAAQNSEDDATKLHGGELGYFSAKRMPPDFIEAAVKMHPGEISKPVRTRLGFHILKLIDVQPPRQQTLEEVRGDIATELANEKRAVAIEKLMVDLRRDTGYSRPF